MGFRAGAYATVWELLPRDNKMSARISTSKKNRETEKYENDFSAIVSFYGEAKEAAKKLRSRDRIKLLEVDVMTRYDAVADRAYTNFYVYKFEPAGPRTPQNAPDGRQYEPQVDASDPDPEEDPAEKKSDLPF